ncbi:MAG: reverse transcriptase domain-containing protein, partial [Mycobacterium sp.]
MGFIDGKPTIQVTVNDVTCAWLFDTGAAVSVISTSLYNDLKPPPPLHASPFAVTGANKKPLKILGQVHIHVSAMDFKGRISALVCSELSQPAILGMDAIRKMKLALNPISQTYFHVQQIEKKSMLARACKRDNFPPFARQPIKIKAADNLTGAVLVTQNTLQYDRSRLHVPDNVTMFTNGLGVIVVKNCSPVSVTLDKDDAVCDVELIEDEVINIDSTHLLMNISKMNDTPLPTPLADSKSKQTFLARIKLNVPTDFLDKYHALFLKNHDVFSKTREDLGSANNFEHTIKLKNTDPIYRKQFRIPEAHQDALHTQIDEWLKIGIIEPCFSRYNSPIFVVPKKDGSFRFVLDYRALNENSLEDRYTMKDVGECIGEIGKAGSTIFSTMDLTWGFHQLPLASSSRPYTAFTCPGRGQFQYNVLSMGLKGGPSSFQRMMELATLGLPNVIVYIDDLLIHTSSHDEHIKCLQLLFNRLRNVNVRLNPDKCEFGATNVSYLGFRLTPKGILPGTDKLKAVKEMPAPQSVTQIRQFLGLCNYFRGHVKNFATVAQPLTHLTKKTTGWLGGKLPPEALQAYHKLRDILVSEPVVAYPRWNVPFHLIVDAATGGAESTGGMGAILGQMSAKN